MIEPRDARVNVFLLKLLREVLVERRELVGMGSVVEGDDDGVLLDADISIDAVKQGPSPMGAIPV